LLIGLNGLPRISHHVVCLHAILHEWMTNCSTDDEPGRRTQMPDLTRKYFWLVTPLTRIEGTANRGERYAEMQAIAGLQLEAGQRAAAAALALAGHHDPSPIMTIESLFIRTTSNLLVGPPPIMAYTP
jgi:hypothetical protein